MADKVVATVRRIDFEPKMEFLRSRIYAHIFLTPRDGASLDVYTDDPTLTAAFLAAWRPMPSEGCELFPPLIEVTYQTIGDVKEATRVALDYDVSGTGPPQNAI